MSKIVIILLQQYLIKRKNYIVYEMKMENIYQIIKIIINFYDNSYDIILQNDKDIVLEAVKQNNYAIKFANIHL